MRVWYILYPRTTIWATFNMICYTNRTRRSFVIIVENIDFHNEIEIRNVISIDFSLGNTSYVTLLALRCCMGALFCSNIGGLIDAVD